MAHHQNDKLPSMISQWVHRIIIRRNCLIEERNERYKMTSFIPMNLDFLHLKPIFENWFIIDNCPNLSFHNEMSRQRNVPTTEHFWPCVHLHTKIAMEKEALEKNAFSLRNRIAKYENAIQQRLRWLKPASHMGLD